MSLVEEDSMRKGVFKWEIGKFVRNRVRSEKSPLFKIGKINCCIWINRKGCEDDFGCWYAHDYHVDVMNDDRGDKNLYSKTFYKLSLIDCNGTNLATSERIGGNADIGIIFCTHYLKYEALTLHFLWYEIQEKGKRGRCARKTYKAISEGQPDRMLENLSGDFRRFYESKTNTDCILRVGDVQFPVHRQVLSARSDVFAAMFRHDTSENSNGIVDIQDVDVTVLNDVLYYVYSGKIRGMSSDTAASIYVVADKYSLIQLKDMCLDVLKHSRTVENVCDAAVLAHIHGESEFEETVVQFMASRLQDIEKTDKWKKLSKTKPSLAIKLLRSTVFACKDKYKKMGSK